MWRLGEGNGGSFRTDVGDVNIAGGKGSKAEDGNVNIGGLGTDIGMLILCGQGRGLGQRLGIY